MGDEYDKAAPDVMENQNFGDNLFDFSVVVIKKEVINFYDSEFESTTSSVQDRKPILQEEIIPNDFEALSSDITDTESFQIHSSNILNCNKIILGSKPNVVYEEEDHFEKSAYLCQENDVVFANNTKLNPNTIDENLFEGLVTSYEPKVELQDIQSYLHKSRRFCETCGILFPELHTFETHVQMFHTERSSAVISHQKSDLAKRRIYKCTICEKKFVAPHVLRNHISTIHRLKNGTKSQTNKHRYKRVLENTMRQHRCPNCGLKFISPLVLKRHLINIHTLNYLRVPNQQNCQSITNIVTDNNSRNVDHDNTTGWSNTCFHCKKPFDTQKALIEHLYDILQMKRKNTEIVPVLKSILFKCNKCDINFTSSQFAANHAEHMEMLINWKCTICNRIFKNEDALSHERQHSVTNNFSVYNLENLDVTKIVYKCSKCGIHFTENNYLYHFRDCGLEYSKFINCKICNMSLDYNLKPLHESNKHTEPNSYTIIESDVISDNPVKLTAKKYRAKEKLKELLESFREVKVVLPRMDSSKQNKLNQLITENWSSECLSDLESSSSEEISNKDAELQKRNNIIRQSKDVDLRKRRNLTYFFCETCKCFVTRHRKNTHLEARCKFFSKETCKYCGLMFTTASLTTHKQLHKEKKDFTLNNFEFFNLYNGRPINPVKTEVKNIIPTVKISKHHGRRNLTYLYCEICKCCLTKFNKAKHLHKRKICKTVSKMSCEYCSLMFTSASMMTHRRLHVERKDLTIKNFKFYNLHNGKRMKPPVPKLVRINRSVNYEADFENIERCENIDDGSTMRNLLYYYCGTCKCCLTRKKNIHIEARCMLLAVSSCELCGLNFTKCSMMTHMRLHEKIKNLTADNFKFLNLCNDQPMNPPVPKLMSMNQSEYNESEVEYKERSEDINDCHTSRNSMYYYCETCRCCVTKRKDVHLEARCTKLAKSSCEHCGLTFTKLSMMKHLRLHEERKDFSLNNFEFFNLYNGQPRNPPIRGVSNFDQPIDTKSKVEHVNKDVENLDETKPLQITDGCTKRNLTYYFCENCKCFVTRYKKQIHLEARCKKLSKGPCKKCGLMFTTATLMTHRQLHNEMKDISRNNFKFFNLHNGQTINPATVKVSNRHGKRNLTYYYCETCKCYLTKFNKATLHKRKLCKGFSKMSCKYCGLMFTSASMMTHRRLHEERKDITLKNFKFFSLNNCQPLNPPEPKLLSINQSMNNEAEVENLECLPNIGNWHTRRNLTYYYCTTCKCFITNFRKDAHLQGRCQKLPKKSCMYCGLMLTSNSMATHLRLHNEKRDLSLQDFNFFNLYNGQPMNPPIPKVINKRPVDIDAEAECLLRIINNNAESENGNVPIDIGTQLVNDNEIRDEYEKVLVNNEAKALSEAEAEVGNENCSENIEGEADNETPSLQIESKNKKVFVNDDTLHLERPINIEMNMKKYYEKVLVNNEAKALSEAEAEVGNENCSENIEGEADNETPSLQIESKNKKVFVNDDTLHLERPINIQTLVENENRPDKNLGEAVNVTPLLHIAADPKKLFPNKEAESLHLERLINIEANVVNEKREGECASVTPILHIEAENKTLFENIKANYLRCERPIIIEAKVINKNRFENIQGESVNVTPLLHNEAKSLRLERPINIEAQVVNENCLEDTEGISINVTALLHIEAENNKKIANQEAEVEETKQLVNDKAKAENAIQPLNIEDNIESIIGAVTNEDKVFNIKLPVIIEAENENIKQPVNNEAQVEMLEMPINSKAECGIIENENLTVNNSMLFNLYKSQPMNPPIPEIVNTDETVNAETEMVEMNQSEMLNKRTVNLKDKIVYVSQLSNNEPKVPHSKMSENTKDWRKKLSLTLYFCETCKCFITKYKKIAHLQARCNILAKMDCKRCGLTFTSASMMTHNRLHEEWKDLTINNFTFCNLNGQPINLPLPENLHRKEPVSVETQVVNIKQPASKEAKVPRRNLKYYFCDTCKCFITNYNKKDAHLQARCKNFSKSNCKRCGLKFTKASMKTHKRLHREKKDLSLKNFKLFNLYNGQPIKAPASKAVNRKRLNTEERILTNYYCITCKCFIISPKKTAHVQANCTNVVKIPCKHCGLILNDTSFPEHKSLHEQRKDLTLDNLKFFDLHSGQAMNPPIPEYPECVNCAVHFLTITAKNSHICSEVSSLTCHICEINLSEAAFKLHMTFHQYATDNTRTITLDRLDPTTNLDQNVEADVTDISNSKTDDTGLHNSLDEAAALLQRSSDMYSLVYCCRNCSTSVDTYDKAIEHSQKHYETDEHVTQIVLCNSCNLKIDETCYMEHQNLHEREARIKLLYFDSYYLPEENNLWIKHIFKTLPNEEVLDILRNSIYGFECRIKMNVIQKGDPNLTVYKCDQCNCFIEPSSLFMHSDNACFKLRNHPCTVCGIAFNSSASRIEHEKIHNQPGLTTESYRIVIFNSERDLQLNRSLCLRKKYVLYKCRNCDAIIDKPREDNHKCDFTNLKNCPDCSLLLNIKDYESHLNKHKQFISFNYKNMKVVLLGESNTLEMRSENNLRSKFKGAVYDYKMFVCNKCEICIKNKECMSKHFCRFGKQRLKCSKCDLYFSIGRLKTHMRCHEQDTDFIRSNMCIISFDPCSLDQNKNATLLFTKEKNCELSDTDSDIECLSANDIGTRDDTETADVTTETVEQETARIYKCSCELHFLNEDSIFRHFGTCRSDSKITKLKCHKCDLLFTPNVLFTHLLAHHNNKGRRYKYEIIQIDHFK